MPLAAQLLGSPRHSHPSEWQVVEQIRWMSSDWEGLVLGVFWLQEEDLLILACRSGGKGAGTGTLLREADG